MEERKIESGGQEMEEDNTELNSNLSNGRWKQVRKKDIDKTWKKTRLNSAQTSQKEDGRKKEMDKICKKTRLNSTQTSQMEDGRKTQMEEGKTETQTSQMDPYSVPGVL